MSTTSTLDAVQPLAAVYRYNETTSAPCTYAKMVWSWQATEDTVVTKLVLNAKTTPASGQDPFSSTAYLFAWTDAMYAANATPFVIYADGYIDWTGTATSTGFTFGNPPLTALVGQRLYFEIGPSLEVPEYTGGGGAFSSNGIAVDRASSTAAAASTTASVLIGHPEDCTAPNTDPYYKPAYALYGYVLSGSSELPDTPVPSSTYDGTYSDLLPTFGFTTGTPLLPGGIYESKFHNMLGGAEDRFPVCMVTPWVRFLDMFQGMTSVAQTSVGIQIQEGLGAGTTTLTLSSASSVFASTGFVDVFNPLVTFLEAAAWLTFGYVVFKDLFMKGNDNDDTL